MIKLFFSSSQGISLASQVQSVSVDNFYEGQTLWICRKEMIVGLTVWCIIHLFLSTDLTFLKT